MSYVFKPRGRQVDQVKEAVEYLKSRGFRLTVSAFYQAAAEMALADYRANRDRFAVSYGNVFEKLTDRSWRRA